MFCTITTYKGGTNLYGHVSRHGYAPICKCLFFDILLRGGLRNVRILVRRGDWHQLVVMSGVGITTNKSERNANCAKVVNR